MESPFAREQDYAFSSFDARAREASERADLRDALAGMKGSRRMTRRELGSAKVWYPSAIVGPAAPCSKRAMFALISADRRCTRGLVALAYRKGVAPHVVFEQLLTLSEVDAISRGCDPRATGYLCLRRGNQHWASISRRAEAAARFMDDGEETYLDEPAEDVAAKIDALDQYSCFSVFLSASTDLAVADSPVARASRGAGASPAAGCAEVCAGSRASRIRRAQLSLFIHKLGAL